MSLIIENEKRYLMRCAVFEQGEKAPVTARLTDELLETYGADLEISDARMGDVVWQQTTAAADAVVFEDIHKLMDVIGNYLTLSYDLEANPVSHLRLLFPRFSWTTYSAYSSIEEILRSPKQGQRVFRLADKLVVACRADAVGTYSYGPMPND